MQNILEAFEDKHGVMELARDRNLWAEQLNAFREGWLAGVLWQSQVTEKYKDFSSADILHGEKDEDE
jgi:hypothetical protein